MVLRCVFYIQLSDSMIRVSSGQAGQPLGNTITVDLSVNDGEWYNMTLTHDGEF
jgi:hypothetical protein